jgi:hypothetical protein
LSGQPFRCSASSVGRDESLAGSASTFRRFLFVEFPGPWGVDALRDSRLSTDVGLALKRRCRGLGIRPALIRRHGRAVGGGRLRVFAADADPHRPWMESAEIDDADDLLTLDLDSLGSGRSLGLDRWEAPVFLTCTHGRHDVCCAERGRPVARALFFSHRDEAWEVSHIGGDRFAANVVVMPHGLFYGRLDPETAARVAVYHHEGRLDLEHLRGRSGYPWPVQAAEIFLRRDLGVDRIDALRLVDAVADPAEPAVHTSRFVGADDRVWSVAVRRGAAGPHRLTCSASRDSLAPTHTLLSITPPPPYSLYHYVCK